MKDFALLFFAFFPFAFASLWVGDMLCIWLARRSDNPAHRQLAALPYLPANLPNFWLRTMRAYSISIRQRDRISLVIVATICLWLVCLASAVLLSALN
mgnify:CR=1 FL=1